MHDYIRILEDLKRHDCRYGKDSAQICMGCTWPHAENAKAEFNDTTHGIYLFHFGFHRVQISHFTFDEINAIYHDYLSLI